MAKSRDDFKETTKWAIARRVGYCCSKPECGKSTEGPHTENSKFLSVGVAAHITAASPKGPRYDPDLTQEERKDASNGIWLCETHAKLIDKDHERYPVSILINWRAAAEAKADGGHIKNLTPEFKSPTEESDNFDQISEALAIMKIRIYKQNVNWNDQRETDLLLNKLSLFSYINSLRIVSEVYKICEILLSDEESKPISTMESRSHRIYLRITEFLRFDKVIISKLNYTPIIHDIIYTATRFVLYQSHCNPERVPSAHLLNLIKFIYLRLIRISDETNQDFVVKQLKRLEAEIENGKSPHRQLYLNLVRQYQRILPNSFMGILPFDDGDSH